MKASDVKASESSKECVMVVKNKMGIHARPAAMIVRVTNKYNDTDVWVQKEGEEDEVNAKSIMGLMMLAAAEGSRLKFIAQGPSAGTVLKEMQVLFDRQFEEM